MAFLNKVGNILKQSASKHIGSHISSQFSASNPCIYQALRCMSSSKIFVGGLPWAVDDSSLREAFSQYGEVLDAVVVRDIVRNKSRGFGFVTFSSTEAVSRAIQAMDGQDLQGRRVNVNFATIKAPPSSDNGSSGYGSGGTSHEVAAGAGDSFYGGGAVGGNVTTDSGFASSGFEGGSGLGSNSGDQFNIGSTSPTSNDAGGNVTTDRGLASSGLEDGSGFGCNVGDQFNIGSTSPSNDNDAGGNVTTDSGLASSELEDGFDFGCNSGDQFDIGSTSSTSNDAGGNVTTDIGLASSGGLEDGSGFGGYSGDQFDIGSTSPTSNDAGDPTGVSVGVIMRRDISRATRARLGQSSARLESLTS